MIETFAAAMLAFLLAMTGMAVGTLAARRGLRAGCAGVRSGMDAAPTCSACREPLGTGGCTGVLEPTEARMKQA
jgi:hypothetical protein